MEKLKGVLYVLIGAASYGVLATFVKKANLEGFSTSGLNTLQYLIGFVGVALLALLNKKNRTVAKTKENKNGKLKLMLFGTAAGLTSYFYYLSLNYIPVSVAIIFLMQAIWLGVVLEMILSKKVDKLKLFGSILVVIGTLFAVNVFQESQSIDPKGFVLGIMASICYTATLYASNTVAVSLPNMVRSKYLVLGGLLIVLLIWNTALISEFDYASLSFWKYGLFLGFFGAVLPPIAFNKGFPITGIGLGSILTSLEIPVSILTASIILHEEIKGIQWFGVFVIIISVAVINYKSIANDIKNTKNESSSA
ncbi:DMT family transporter [Cellulophaga sp. 20_2_10]|uniref:EamA family transporter n=1 Tax=Cellulophaga sp. 20_2_10 TaxID=2942476 RepID=UPI00201B2053|nr:DMT family transporter [Cellulophaga sp. 20_2_10]MCL5247409.1 DMT family transporter [Cellulophaga sp. 20_2_10]